MAKKIYVGNLNYRTTEDALRSLFEVHGTVNSVKVITDRETGYSKGFGFVEMDTDQAATDAITALNGKEIEGRQLRVNEANERPEAPRRNFSRQY